MGLIDLSDLQALPETLQAVQSTIAKQLSIEESRLTPESKFADLGADSLDIVCNLGSLMHFLRNISRKICLLFTTKFRALFVCMECI